MRKISSRLVCFVLVITLMFGVVATPGSAAFTMTETEWARYWSTVDKASVHLAPGSDASEMNVSWLGDFDCDEPAVFVRETGTDDYSVYVGTTVYGEDVVSNRVTVKNLVPDTTYEYYCVSGDYQSKVATFKTASEGAFSALLVSDIHISYDEENSESIKQNALSTNNIYAMGYERDNNISLIISVGDNADAGRLDEYEGLFASPVFKSLPLASVCGNHDFKDDVYPQVMSYPNNYNKQAVVEDKNGGDYWFVKGDVLFLMINSNWISADDHRTFVELAVKANPDVKWRVAVMHHDLYGGHLKHRESENVLNRAMFTPIFDEFGVDLVLMGHSHIYSRSHVIYDNNVVENLRGDTSVTDAEGTIYLTTGSISRPRDTDESASYRIAYDYLSPTEYIYDILEFSEDSITITAYSSDKEEPIDNFTIYKTTSDGGHSYGVNEGDGIVYLLSMIAAIFYDISLTLESFFNF